MAATLTIGHMLRRAIKPAGQPPGFQYRDRQGAVGTARKL
jgi:hypothetical protein